MIKETYSILIVFLLLTSCFTDVIEDIPDKSMKILHEPIIHIKDTARELKIEKTYIFKSGYLSNAYAYGDLLKLENGNILLVCNTANQITDWTSLDIIISESQDNGKSWSKPQKIEHSLNEPYINTIGPSLVNIGEGHIMLFFMVKYSDRRIDIMYKESLDYGKSWGNDQIVYKEDQGYITSSNNRVNYSNNRIIIPLAIPNDANNIYKSMSAFYYYSDDLGITWQRSSNIILPNVALLEPDIVRINDFELLMNIRLNLGFILFARSRDNGNSWIFENSNIPSTSSPQKLIKLPQPNFLLMVWNYGKTNNQLHHTGNRNPISIGISSNKGYTWEFISHIENNPDYDYSYPSITLIEDSVYISYYEILKGKGNYSLKLAKIAVNDLFK